MVIRSGKSSFTWYVDIKQVLNNISDGGMLSYSTLSEYLSDCSYYPSLKGIRKIYRSYIDYTSYECKIIRRVDNEIDNI